MIGGQYIEPSAGPLVVLAVAASPFVLTYILVKANKVWYLRRQRRQRR